MAVEDENASCVTRDDGLLGMVSKRLRVMARDGVQKPMGSGNNPRGPVAHRECVEHPDCRYGKHRFPSLTRSRIPMEALLAVTREWIPTVSLEAARGTEHLRCCDAHDRVSAQRPSGAEFGGPLVDPYMLRTITPHRRLLKALKRRCMASSSSTRDTTMYPSTSSRSGSKSAMGALSPLGGGTARSNSQQTAHHTRRASTRDRPRRNHATGPNSPRVRYRLGYLVLRPSSASHP